MTDLQQKLLSMLKWFHTFCMEHNLRYYAIGGTLLGVVRHKGFIPWDDDIDLGMPREDYERLQELLKPNKDEKYRLEIPLENKDFVYQYCKLYDSTTTLIENTRYKTKRGIYLDIFPLDGIGNDIIEAKNTFKRVNRMNNYIMTKVCALSKYRRLYKNIAIIVSRIVPFPSWRSIIKKENKILAQRKFDDCVYVGNMLGNWGVREIAKREWFGNPTEYDFETITIYGLEHPEKYLTAVYGDFIQLPPEEKRVSHHQYLFLDLHNPYLGD